MKITLENPSLMVLKDNHYGQFIGGIVFVALGIITFFILSKGNTLVIAIAALIALGGVYAFISNKSIEAKLDKATSKFSVSMLSVLKGKEYKEFQLSQIKELVLRSFLTTKKGHTRTNFVLDFSINTGEIISLEFGQVSMMGINADPRERKRIEAKKIADFLGLPLKEQGPSTMDDMVNEQSDLQGSMEQFKK
ncbi:MAG: hypothetical protein V1492_05370 [Candidatus Micrarchaeota archaeon]